MIDHRAYHDHFHHLLKHTRSTEVALKEIVRMAYSQGHRDGERGAPSAVTLEAPVTGGHGAPTGTKAA